METPHIGLSNLGTLRNDRTSLDGSEITSPLTTHTQGWSPTQRLQSLKANKKSRIELNWRVLADLLNEQIENY
jgi:hypothetical protein